MRGDCYNSLLKQGGLLIENIEVSIKEVKTEFGYSIGLWEDVFNNLIHPGYK